jgi:ankyrin repeat protein
MLEACANPERTDTSGHTILHFAALEGRLEECRLLLDWGARILPTVGTKFTPLHWAVKMGHFSVAKLLVERGADVTLKSSLHKTACDTARTAGHKDLANWLDTVSRDKV